MEEILLLLGGNIGEVKKNMDCAVELLEEKGVQVIAASSDYKTEPWGFESDNMFLNRAVRARTMHSPTKVMEILNSIENEVGRERNESEGYTDRMIDIDLLLFGEQSIKNKNLEVPHPRMSNRKFALVPAAEVAAEMKDPRTGKSMHEMLKECTDDREVEQMK